MNILDPAIFDMGILTSILEDFKPIGRPDPRYAYLGSNTFPPEWDAVARRVLVDIMPEAKKRKTQLGLDWFEPKISSTGRN